MVTVVSIPADPEQPITRTELDGSLESYRAAVGGWLECLTLPSGAAFFVNEEGKLLGLRANARATEYLEWSFGYFFDVICGDALIVGPPDKHGNTTSVPTHVLEHFNV